MKYPSACSGVTLSDRVAIDGTSNIMSCFVGAALLESADANILSPLKEDQDGQSTDPEKPNKVSQKAPTVDDISLRWDAPTGEDIQRNDAPLTPKFSLEYFDDYCFETAPQAATSRSPLSPPPTPRPNRAMIQHLRHPIPEKLLVPVF
jgi:hypothetical protein